jgi:Tfp pilus assembly protein PilF
MRLLIYTHGKTGSTALAYSALARLAGHRLIFEPPSLDIIPDEPNLIVKYISPNWSSDHQHLANYDTIIVLVRHPFDVLISAMMYFPFTVRDFIDDVRMAQFHQLLRRMEAKDDGMSMRTVWEWLARLRPRAPFTGSTLRQFDKLRLSVEAMNGDRLLMKYENLRSNPASVDDALGFAIPANTPIAPAFQRVERSKGTSGWQHWFSAQDCLYFAGFEEVRRYAQTCGYDLADAVSPAPAREPRAGTEYVCRLSNLQRKRFSVPPFDPCDDKPVGLSSKLMEALTLRLDERDKEKAFDSALCALLEQPRHSASLLEFGIGALINGFAAGAQHALCEVVSMTPDNAVAWNYLAESYRATGQLEEAVRASREAVRIEPDSADHNQLLGSLLNRLGRWQEAEEHLRFAVDSPSGLESFKWAFINNLRAQKKYDQALVVLQGAGRALGHSAEYARLQAALVLERERAQDAAEMVG